MFGYNRDFGQNNLTFGVSMDIPIFYRNQGRIARVTAETDRELQTLLARQLAVRREVREAYNLSDAQAQIVEALQAEYVPTAQRARDIAQASYSLGALDLIAFLDAERAYRETLRGYYSALYEHQVSRFLLEAVVGRDGSQ
jgi:cobalt-zinc-cadmium efflux system outer membrane protein